MTHLELFAGIGGIALASEWAGFEHVGFVERDPFCQKVLAKHWPHVPIYDDVRTFDGTKFRGVDLISGGFPCQPHSLAGSRKASSDERDLWGETKRILGVAKPRWFVGENVPGLLSSESGRFFGRVVDDLAALGYRVGFAVYGASDVGAVHRRNRVFIVAYSDCGGPQDGRGFNGTEMGRCDSRWGGSTVLGSAAPECGFAGQADTPADTIGNGREPRNYVGWGDRPSDWREWGVSPTVRIEPRVRGSHDGISNRVDRLKALGNAVVPQQIYPILKAIAEASK
jgi:DNA (cytosine-5)-methyltransferase 1